MLERKHLFIRSSFLLLLLFTLTSCGSLTKSKNCLVKRAAFDIGSGSTKMTLAKVNTCTNKIVEVFFEDQAAVSYKQSLYDNKNSFNKEIISQGISELKELKQTAVELGVTEFSALATQAFREATNGESSLEKISEEIDIEIRIINQELEARFGYLGAKVKHPFADDEKILVWDIGGGSMQMTFVEDGKYHTYLGNLASVSFKESVLKNLYKGKKGSPNPLGKTRAKQARVLARFFAKGNVDKEVQEYIKTARVFGIGGVHYYSVKNQALEKGHIYNQTQLRIALNKRSKLNDKKIGGKFAATDVTNIALVLGFMEALGIRKVEALKVNMSHGLFLDKASW